MSPRTSFRIKRMTRTSFRIKTHDEDLIQDKTHDEDFISGRVAGTVNKVKKTAVVIGIDYKNYTGRKLNGAENDAGRSIYSIEKKWL